MSLFSNIDGGRSRISTSGTSQGVYRRRFLALVVDTPGSPALAPPGGPPSTFLSVDGGVPGSPSPAPPEGPLSTFLRVYGGRS
jgi:hypothetical protein